MNQVKHYLFIFIFIFTCYTSFTQKNGGTLEIAPYVRFDRYPQFSYVLNGRYTTDYVKIKGVSVGTDVIYKIPISKTWLIWPGVGFYQYSFNHINNLNTSFGKSNARNINFPSPLFILFYTDKYRYNSIYLNFGMEKRFFLSGNYQLRLAADVKNYWTFSQVYHLDYNPDGNQKFKTNDFRYFGASALLAANFVKHFGRYTVGPSFMLPIYDRWKTDYVFPEEDGVMYRSKLFNGAGLGVVFNYTFNKK